MYAAMFAVICRTTLLHIYVCFYVLYLSHDGPWKGPKHVAPFRIIKITLDGECIYCLLVARAAFTRFKEWTLWKRHRARKPGHKVQW